MTIEGGKQTLNRFGYKRKDLDLADALGVKSRVSVILNKKRKLTLDMIRKLNEALGLPTVVDLTNIDTLFLESDFTILKMKTWTATL